MVFGSGMLCGLGKPLRVSNGVKSTGRASGCQVGSDVACLLRTSLHMTKITMAEVARQLGVAPSTVSRALRGDTRISKKLREEVREVADRLGYRPNPLVSALMAQRENRAGTIALVTDYNDPAGWEGKDVCRWEYEGIARRADELGFQLEIFPLSEHGGSLAELEKVLLARGIRGVLLGFSRARKDTTRFTEDRFALAGLSAYFRNVPVDRANFHGLFNVRLALDELRALGYKKTGLVVPERNNRISGYHWSGGFLDWQLRFNETTRCAPYLHDEKTSAEDFYRWLDKETPDSLVVYKTPVRSYLAKRGLRIPEDIAVAALYRTEEERQTMPGIDGNLQAVGAAALDLVVERLNVNRTGLPADPKEVLIKGRWIGE